MTNEIKEILDYFENNVVSNSIYMLKLDTNEAKLLLDYITNLQEENKQLKENNLSMQEEMSLRWNELDNLQQRIDKTDKFLEELISSTKGVINDYSYHKEHNKILIELFEEDIEFYKKALDILRGDE
ncbi:MAG: hypothetical protein J6T10_21645 [Methanobrevibacter sp.]|nr:hypothetical protein [Methanobrevibacter sp.]